MRLMRIGQVTIKTGLSRSSIYDLVSKDTFPKQISLGGRSVAWIEDEINEWLEQKIKISRGLK